MPISLVLCCSRNVSLKSLIGATVNALVNGSDMNDRIIASCWEFDQIIDSRSSLPSTPRQYLTAKFRSYNVSDDHAFFSNVLRLGINGFSLNHGLITSEFVNQAHQRLLSVIAWTVDGQENIQRMIRANVDGVITNDPKAARQLIQHSISGCKTQVEYSDCIVPAVAVGLIAFLLGISVAMPLFKLFHEKQATAQKQSVKLESDTEELMHDADQHNVELSTINAIPAHDADSAIV